MARTDKTQPYWVRSAQGLPDFVRPCGRGCIYCGIGRTRKKFEGHKVRHTIRTRLVQERWRDEY